MTNLFLFNSKARGHWHDIINFLWLILYFWIFLSKIIGVNLSRCFYHFKILNCIFKTIFCNFVLIDWLLNFRHFSGWILFTKHHFQTIFVAIIIDKIFQIFLILNKFLKSFWSKKQFIIIKRYNFLVWDFQ